MQILIVLKSKFIIHGRDVNLIIEPVRWILKG